MKGGVQLSVAMVRKKIGPSIAYVLVSVDSTKHCESKDKPTIRRLMGTKNVTEELIFQEVTMKP